MSRNLVICCDGTNNQFGIENTNVVRLVQVLERESASQAIYYDPGVGTLPEPQFLTRTGKKVSGWVDLAFATGLNRRVQKAYAYIMDVWEPGDRVFLFGFSRGAYTVRVLAGMLHALGLLPKKCHNLLPYAMRLFKAARGDDYWRLCNQFRRSFSRPIEGQRVNRFPVHFLGVWDTVSSVGWVWDPVQFPYTAKNPSVKIARHAVAIDEQRWFYRQNLLRQTRDQDLRQMWFPGVHSDVGGGYPEADSGIWRTALDWMIGEAEKAGLLISQPARQRVLTRTLRPCWPWNDTSHRSLERAWWLAEVFPKRVWRSGLKRRKIDIGRGRHRVIPEGAWIHWSALARMQQSQYAPPNMTRGFLERVRRLAEIPEFLPYEAEPSAVEEAS